MNFCDILVLIVLLVARMSYCQPQYLQLRIYNTPLCSNESDIVSWQILSLPTTCYDVPFGNFVRYDIDNITFTINYTVYDNIYCSGNHNPNLTMTNIPQMICTEFYAFESFFYIKFLLLDQLPYNESDLLEGWIIGENFLDDFCARPYDTFDEPLTTLSAWRHNDNDDPPRATQDFLLFFRNMPYPNDGRIIDLQERKKYEGVCQTLVLSSFKMNNRTFSFRRKYLTDEEVLDENILEIPFSSTSKYIVQSYSYNENCSDYWQMSPVTLDECSRSRKFVSSGNSPQFYASFNYLENDCSGIPIDIKIVRKSSVLSEENDLFDVCHFLGEMEIHHNDIEVFHIFRLSNDPYSPLQLAWVYDYELTCDDRDLLEIMLDPGSVYTEYVDEEFCQSTFDTRIRDVPSSFSLGQSFRGFCTEDGMLVLKVFLETDNCVGMYETRKVDRLCYHRQYTYFSQYIHLLCLPRFCDGISSLDTDNVCNGRGICIEKDQCSCGDGYHGDFCEKYYCFGIYFEKSDVCSGNGKCNDHDKCICNSGFSGEKCERNEAELLGIILGSTITPLFVTVLILFVCSFVLILYCVGFVFIFFLCSLCISCCGVMFFFQQKRLSKFTKLDDFDLLYQEQLLEKDETIAHLRIRKELFEINYEEINIVKMIGRGGSDSVIFKGVWNGTTIAFKSFNTRRVCSSQENFEDFETELLMLTSLHHPSVIRFFGAALKPPRVGIAMEFCENGEILEFFRNYKDRRRTAYPLEQKMRMIQEIISAVRYIHARNIIHRDLKPENVLIDVSERTKLADFGISRLVESGERNAKTRRVGTSFYMAPEVLSGKYDHLCDSFSFAIMLWTIFTEDSQPYKEFGGYSIEFRVANNDDFRPDIDELPYDACNGKYGFVKDVILKCWGRNPKKRYDFDQLYEIFAKETKKSDSEKNELLDGGKKEEDLKDELIGGINNTED